MKTKVVSSINMAQELFIITTHHIVLEKKGFTPDAFPAATLPIYPRLGPASGNTEMCP